MYLFWEQKGKNERTKRKVTKLDGVQFIFISLQFLLQKKKKKVSHSSTIILIELTISTGKSAR